MWSKGLSVEMMGLGNNSAHYSGLCMIRSSIYEDGMYKTPQTLF